MRTGEVRGSSVRKLAWGMGVAEVALAVALAGCGRRAGAITLDASCNTSPYQTVKANENVVLSARRCTDGRTAVVLGDTNDNYFGVSYYSRKDVTHNSFIAENPADNGVCFDLAASGQLTRVREVPNPPTSDPGNNPCK